MIEDIRALTAQLAADPTSLVFLRLGEALRRRGHFDVAAKVALAGLSRYPHMPDAHDLYARILSDREDLAQAFDEWDMALRLDPGHTGAHKGIGYLYFKAGDRHNAKIHLEAALAAHPEDEGVRRALDRVSAELDALEGSWSASAGGSAVAAEPAATAGHSPPQESETGEGQWLLVDAGGLRLGGTLTTPGGAEIGDEIAALVASTTREAVRAARLLELGEWQLLLVESPDINLCLLNPTPDTCLIAAGDPVVPMGQLGLVAQRAARAARRWLAGVAG